MPLEGKVEAYVAFKMTEDGDITEYSLQSDREDIIKWVKLDEQSESTSNNSGAIVDSENSEQINEKIPFSKIMKRIRSVMMSYNALIFINYHSRSTFAKTALREGLIATLDANGNVIDEDSNYKIYEIDDRGLRNFLKFSDTFKEMDEGMKALNPSTLLSIASTFDSIISEIVGTMLRSRKEKLKTEGKSVPINDILTANSIDEIIEKVILNEVYELLRGGHDDQIVFIEKNFNISIKKDWDKWPDLMEIFERRNLIAHGEKLYTNRYINLCKGHGSAKNTGKQGSAISISAKYLRNCVDICMEFLLLLVFSLWRKHFKVEELAAFEDLNESCYELIIRGKFNVAERILSHATSLKGTACTDSVFRMMIINRANALKNLDKLPDAIELVDSMDWSATSEDFKICVHAVKNEVEEVVKLMKIVVHSEKISKQNFIEWPVFKSCRENEEFKCEFKALFGENIAHVEMEQKEISLKKSSPSNDAITPSDNNLELNPGEETKH